MSQSYGPPGALGAQSAYGPPPLPVQRWIGLTVAEAAELAKAGVKVELAGKVTIDTTPPPMQQPLHHGCGNDISHGIRERWIQSKRAKRTAMNDGGDFMRVPELCAFQHGDKVYVFVYGGNAPPEVIEDDAAIYPSDALLARVHLMMQHAR
jgi:hypothetical protein